MVAYYGEKDGTPNKPRPYQRIVAKKLRQRKNIVLTAPTGAGKTLAVLAPFLEHRTEIGVRRLIYCLPMRTLAEGILAEARGLVRDLGLAVLVTIQTGERPEDPFFLGDIIVCTYDQFLSGLLCGPYSLSRGLHNINAAAALGSLVVFDEFHLMEVDKAFLTAITMLRVSGAHSLSVWMTATATNPLKDRLVSQLGAEEVELESAELQALEEVRKRRFAKHDTALTAQAILENGRERRLVVVNTVSRAQQLFRDLLREATGSGIEPKNLFLLHSRFFSGDKENKRRRLYEIFGKGRQPTPAVAIATQVVEAGLDISAERLLTELCPMSALLQRAGRCARFEGQDGVVEVYRGPDLNERPYSRAVWERTWEVLEDCDELLHDRAIEWVNKVHQEDDAGLLRDRQREAECRRVILDGVQKLREGGVGHLIRGGSSDLAVAILREPNGVVPAKRESISVRRSTVKGLLGKGAKVWQYDPDADSLWVEMANVEKGYIAAVTPEFMRYTEVFGLEPGQPGEVESPERIFKALRPEFTYTREGWANHTAAVRKRASEILREESVAGGLLDGIEIGRLLDWAALLHDLGKLQRCWQDWANRYEKARDPDYVVRRALAHTESQSERDRGIARSLGRKPPHAEASAVYGDWLLAQVVPEMSDRDIGAILGAVVSHHGGWFRQDTAIGELDKRLKGEIADVGVVWHGCDKPRASDREDSRTVVLNAALGEGFAPFWRRMSLIVRLLRLADQKATADG
jgi:CRISPR-associated endonuclease/helicase Cas3